MKGNNSAALRALYIILVPIVLLIILLNSGWLQRLLPAVKVHGENYSVTRYNFYYFDYYNSFLEENEDRLAELGYDPEQADSEQSYDGSITWKEYFQQQAEADLAETAYYCDLAEAAGYEFTEEELAPVEERLAEDEARCAEYGINASNYYTAYYGAGMNQERYVQELTYKVQAQAYKAHLMESYDLSQTEIDAWLAEHPTEDYQLADIWIVELDAVADRGTGQVGASQLEALETRLARLEERFAAGNVTMAELSAKYGDQVWGDGGLVQGADRDGLPAVVADWCFDQEQAAMSSAALVDRAAGKAYLVLLEELGGSYAQKTARDQLTAQAFSEIWQAAAADYQVERHSIGMLLAAA